MTGDPNNDAGEATTQLVIVLPVVVFILLLAIQAALYFHISHVAGAAAAEGASVASARGLSTAEATRRGRDRADALVRETGTDPGGPTSVSVSSNEVQVTVRTRVPSIIPFFPVMAIRTVVEPRERFITEYLR